MTRSTLPGRGRTVGVARDYAVEAEVARVRGKGRRAGASKLEGRERLLLVRGRGQLLLIDALAKKVCKVNWR